jgi:hypothetical protein
MTAYLIQRAKFEKRENKKGIDSILKFDYMGSSEFEWGALPNALYTIKKDIKDYIYRDINISEKIITVFYNKKESLKNITEYLGKLSRHEFRLKEYSAFDEYIKSEGYFSDKIDFWWDIENHIMFWKKNIDFENEFVYKIEGK